MPLHPNIDSDELSSSGMLLSDKEQALVSEIESFLTSMQEEINDIVTKRNHYNALKEECFNELDKFRDPISHIDRMLFPQHEESVEDYKSRVFSALSQFEEQLRSDDAKAFIQALKEQLAAVTDQAESTDLYQNYLEHLYSLQDEYGEKAQDPIVIAELEDKLETIRQEEDVNYQQEESLKQAIHSFKDERKVDFELDSNYQLIKISKRSHDLNHSIIYVSLSPEEQPRAFALYQGKATALGEGGFGKVKLCQDIHTGEWMAIKIQKSIMKEPSKAENETLKHFGRFFGETLRDDKYYSVQSLLLGVDLQKHIASGDKADFLSRLDIAQKAAALVQEFHRNYLHRDIKPENFIWDEENKTLHLCDFGMACKLDAGQEGIMDLSGSGTFLAPEIDDSLHRGSVLYTKKSDMYALGKVFNELFTDIADVPPEIGVLIQNMTEADPALRIENAGVVTENLAAIEAIHAAKTTPLPAKQEQAVSSNSSMSFLDFKARAREQRQSQEEPRAPSPHIP
ncbi:protein kinase domain-containing protein [Legionella oakridgensis]|uniref:Protein kinase domain protein n=2 Tax=Legionella oakridgensis TaxID=29423 RepID=W0B7G7_9GAMM|nr:protein kinase [Legionella oakridgensis]AHE66493.1 protein kinase domain protein [Legionella oakridgensis ATCC 33761 = DSM 21215]KTD43937.1 serine/threonine-protein kinase [Legionella oakridgensis]STY19658.1 serine/threonine-protein kinase [Legionella longbeachae]